MEGVASFFFGRRLPDKVSTRVGLNGQPGGQMPKAVVLWMGPIVALVAGVIILLPGGRNLGRAHLWISMTMVQAVLLGVMTWMFKRNLGG